MEIDNLDNLIDQWENEYNKDKHNNANSVINIPHESSNPWELSPYHLFDYITTLSRYKFSTYMQFDPPVRFQIILENWINNFLSDKDKFTAFKLSSRILFITQHELEYLQRYVYRKFISQYGWQINESLEEFLFVPLEEDVKVAEFFRLNQISGREDKVGGSKSYLNCIDEFIQPIKEIEKIDNGIKQIKSCEHLNNLDRDNIIAIMEKAKIQYTAELEKKNKDYEQRKYLILLTDFSGSGATVKNDITRILTHYSFEFVFLFSYIICEDSLNKLLITSEQNANKINIIYGLLLTSKAKCFAEDSIILFDPDKSEIRKLCDKYFFQLKEHPDVKQWQEDIKYGFKENQLTLVLDHNCPNNTLPIMWAENSNWKALFPRVPKYIFHSTGGKEQK